MNNLSPEEIALLATTIALELTKCQDIKTIKTIKTITSQIVCVLNTIICEKEK